MKKKKNERGEEGTWDVEGIVQQSRGASSSELLLGGKIRVSAQKLREQKEIVRASRPPCAIVFIPAFFLFF
jgi:hypothetical protein